MKNPLYINKRLTTTGARVKRTVYDFYPVFHIETTDDVWDIVNNAGQEVHPAYGTRENKKNSRLSCRLCYLADKQDLRYGALGNMDVYHQYLAIERVIQHTMIFKSTQKTIKTNETCLITGETVVRKTVKKTITTIPLNEHIGVPFDELEVQRYVKIFTQKRQELLEEKDNEEAAKAEKRRQKHSKTTKADDNQLAIAI